MNRTITTLAAHALLGQKRGLVLLLFPVGFIVLAAALHYFGATATAEDVAGGLGYRLMLPLVALLTTTSVLGPEVDDGSIVYLLAKPVNRYVVAISKYVVAVVVTLVVGAAPIFVGGLILDGSATASVRAWALAAAVVTPIYCALFLAAAAVTRHAVVVGLLFVLMWEQALGRFLTGIAWASVYHWGIRVAMTIDGWILGPELPAWYPAVAGTIVTLGGLWFAGDRLRSFTLRGDE